MLQHVGFSCGGVFTAGAILRENIADLVKIDQNIIPILMREGMHCIGCPSAQAESLEEAAMVHGLDPDVLVARLNNFLGEE